jgi:hypothetical protein
MELPGTAKEIEKTTLTLKGGGRGKRKQGKKPAKGNVVVAKKKRDGGFSLKRATKNPMERTQGDGAGKS